MEGGHFLCGPHQAEKWGGTRPPVPHRSTPMPETNSKKYGYADDLALLKVHQDWNTIEETLTQDMSILSSWLKQWRLKLSEAKTVSSTLHLNNREAKRDLNVNISGRRLTCHRTPTYLGVKLDRTLTYRERLTALRGKVMARTALIRLIAGTSWGASTPTLRTSTLALVYAPAEYCAPVWCRSSHNHLVDVGLNASLRTITGCLRPTLVDQLPVLAEIAPPALRREAATLVLGRRACQHDHLLHDVMGNATHRKRLKSRRPLTHHAHQLVSSVPPQDTGHKQGGLSRGHPPPRDYTNTCPHHQTADKVWAYPDEPGPD